MIQKIKKVIKNCLKFIASLIKVTSSNWFVF